MWWARIVGPLALRATGWAATSHRGGGRCAATALAPRAHSPHPISICLLAEWRVGAPLVDACASMHVATSICNCVQLGKTTLTSLRAKSGSLEQVHAVFPQACSVFFFWGGELMGV
jgi:hypothetical protein